MRRYLYKEISEFNTEEGFQRVLDELSRQGWKLQEFHPVTFISITKICAVFYKDEE